MTNETIANYWIDHYAPTGFCTLCGNRGIIDTRGVTTPAGHEAGRLNWCICPNGQKLRSVNDREPIHEDLYPDNLKE